MENVVLIVHLVLALCLIGVVLLQRSEGGGLGIGGGGGATAGRSPLTALGKLTWLFAIAFIATSVTLTIIAAENSADSSVLDRIGVSAPVEEPEADVPGLPSGESLLPPATGDAPALPPRAE